MADYSVIGAGSWGIALAKVLAQNGNDVTVWSIIEDEINMLKENKEHLTKLPGVKLPDNMSYTTNLEEAIKGKEMLILAVPSPFTRSTAKSMAPFVGEGQLIVNVAKGIEDETYMTLTDIIEQEIPQATVAVLSGPSHAEEVGKNMTTTLVAGAKKKATAEYIQNAFMCDFLRVYTSPDVLGIELGGALKNVVALAAGIADGLGCGDNAKAALITRGIVEIARLGVAMGGKIESFTGLTGIGDLIVTCSSMHSRNRRAGMLIGQGYTMQEAMDEVKMVVEGVYSAKAAAGLAEKYNISMPIVKEVNDILFGNQTAEQAITDLMFRDKRSEASSLTWEE
ncbi:MAG: NAD(P)-dependent glycerol-3-phosphate dehydrogenase [Lachnospiraceae bacterium]|nr:NAD(P)-dependent glycerol-3-phosphate dehydrogenase [Lachnospiraceae bacterium]